MWYKTTIFYAILAIAFSGMNTNSVYACSGGGQTELEDLIKEAELIVWGTVLEVDDANQNGTFHVEEYWKGKGGQYLTINQNTTEQIHYLNDRDMSGDCDDLDTMLHSGERRVMFLYRSFDGTYGTSTGISDGGFVFETPTTPTRHFGAEYTFSELRTEITTQAGAIPQPPDHQITPSLPTPILIQTDNNSIYMLPVDTNEPILLAENVEYAFTGQKSIVLATHNDFFYIERHYHRLFSEPQDDKIHPFRPILFLSSCEEINCFAFAPKYDYAAFSLNETTIRLCVSQPIVRICKGI